MIVHPYRDRSRLEVFAGTNIIREDFGLTGVHVLDPDDPSRLWRIESFYRQPEIRSLRGIRAKVMDAKGFVSFVLQADLEVLLGYGKPGQTCAWSGRSYGAPGDRDFYGVAADDDDLRDDLYDRELVLRGENRHKYGGVLPPKAEIRRRVHLGHREDVEELFVLLRDVDPDTGGAPDLQLKNVSARWARAERTPVLWKLL
jgi:hypothetical protein